MAGPRILVVKLSALGDLFHALPAVHALKHALDAEIHWITHTQYVPLVQCFTDVTRVLPFYRHSFFRDAPRFLRALRETRYDIALDMQGLLKSALVLRLARATRRIGPAWAKEGARLFYSEQAGTGDRTRHALDRMYDVLPVLDVPVPDTPVFPVTFPELTLDAPRPRIGVLPVSRWPTKNWPVANFAAVADALHERVGGSIFLLGGPEDDAVCAALERQVTCPVENRAGQDDLVGLGSLLQELDLLLCNDSGPMHMAAALGTPVLAVFGPTDPGRTGPVGAAHRTLSADVPCRPCFARSCRQGDLRCLAGVTPAQVVDAAAAGMLGETTSTDDA